VGGGRGGDEVGDAEVEGLEVGVGSTAIDVAEVVGLEGGVWGDEVDDAKVIDLGGTKVENVEVVGREYSIGSP
jgi:hypothetical protein